MSPMIVSRCRDEQRQERADAGRGERREDRHRVDVALVEHAEDDVDGDERGRDEQPLARQRVLEGLGGAREARDHARREHHVALRGVDRVDGLAERRVGREVEGEGDARELPLVGDRERGARRLVVDDRRDRDLRSVAGLHEDLRQRVGALLVLRRDVEQNDAPFCTLSRTMARNGGTKKVMSWLVLIRSSKSFEILKLMLRTSLCARYT